MVFFVYHKEVLQNSLLLIAQLSVKSISVVVLLLPKKILMFNNGRLLEVKRKEQF